MKSNDKDLKINYLKIKCVCYLSEFEYLLICSVSDNRVHVALSYSAILANLIELFWKSKAEIDLDLKLLFQDLLIFSCSLCCKLFYKGKQAKFYEIE